MTIEPGAEPDWLALPTCGGVAVLEDGDGRAAMVASGADLRALVRRRLGPDGPRPGAPDLRPVVRRVRAARVGSMFEADLAFLALARERLPGVYRAACDRWQGWFVGADPGAPFPRFVKRPTSSMAGDGAPDAGERLLGPVADKHAAGRLIELVEDLFDLCRYHHLLVQAPRATACAYKEMGRCPAPCDGSETMDAYRERFARAASFLATGPADAIARAEARMREAAADEEFEEAASIKAWIDRARGAAGRAYARLGDARRARWLALAGAERPGWARVMALTPEPIWVADVPAEGGDASLVGRRAAALAASAPGAGPAGRVAADTLGLVASWLVGPARDGRWRACEFLRLPGAEDSPGTPGIADALRRLARRWAGEDDRPHGGDDRELAGG